MSLVPDKESTHFASGPKILELGLTGFTGRLIISQQALKQYTLVAADDNDDDDDDENSDIQTSSTTSFSKRRSRQDTQAKEVQEMQQQQASKSTITAEQKTRTSSKATFYSTSNNEKPALSKPKPNRTLDQLAEVMLLDVPSAPKNTTQRSVSATIGVDVDSSSGHSSGVEVVSVASSVSTRGGNEKRSRKEDTLTQLATAFTEPVTDLHQLSSSREIMERIDEDSQQASSQSNGSSRKGGVSSNDSENDPLTAFATAFVALDSASSNKGTKQGVSIDSSGSSREPSLVSSSASSESEQSDIQSQVVKNESDPTSSTDPLSQFAEVFGELSAVKSKPNQGDIIDEASKSSRTESSEEEPHEPSQSHSHTSASQQSDDPLTQFTNVYKEYSDGDHPPMSPQTPATSPPPPFPSATRERGPPGKYSHRQSQQATTKKKRVSKTQGSRRVSIMTAERKKKIRDLFPNYPDVRAGSHGSFDPVGAYLHQKCAAPLAHTLKARDLRELLEVFPFAAYCADDKGRLPLHTLGENSQLVQDQQGRTRATNLARILIRAYPESVKYPDSEGMLPFVALIYQWVEQCYDGNDGSAAPNKSKKALLNSTGALGEASKETNSAYNNIFPNRAMTPQVEWCLRLMSIVLDDMVGRGILKEAFASKSLQEQMESRRRYVDTILERVPYLVKAILFLDAGDGPTRKRIAQMSFVRRALLSRESVGGWIQAMASRQGQPSRVAMDYFQLLRNTTPQDFVGPKREPDEEDVEAFKKHRDRVYRKIEKMELILPSQVKP